MPRAATTCFTSPSTCHVQPLPDARHPPLAACSSSRLHVTLNLLRAASPLLRLDALLLSATYTPDSSLAHAHVCGHAHASHNSLLPTYSLDKKSSATPARLIFLYKSFEKLPMPGVNATFIILPLVKLQLKAQPHWLWQFEYPVLPDSLYDLAEKHEAALRLPH